MKLKMLGYKYFPIPSYMINWRIYDFLLIILTTELGPLTRVLTSESQKRVHLSNQQSKEAICQTSFDIGKRESWLRLWFSIFEFPFLRRNT